jgi:outer membrane protein TolC
MQDDLPTGTLEAMAAVARAKVNTVMGRAADASLNVLEEFNTPPPGFDLSQLREEAQKRKPSFVGMEWGAKMAQDGVTSAKKQQLPDFKISLGYKTARSESSGDGDDMGA